MMASDRGRPQRLETLRDLVTRRDFRNQRQLQQALGVVGIKVNQSTLSRDLAELSIRKSNGRYRIDASRERSEPSRTLASAVHGWSACGPHLLVVRTSIGQAQAVGVAIDQADEASIAGTLAGDDTVFVATTSATDQKTAIRRLTSWFGDGHEQRHARTS
jgi:transcriptional regulator of arginine metabolism